MTFIFLQKDQICLEEKNPLKLDQLRLRSQVSVTGPVDPLCVFFFFFNYIKIPIPEKLNSLFVPSLLHRNRWHANKIHSDHSP